MVAASGVLASHAFSGHSNPGLGPIPVSFTDASGVRHALIADQLTYGHARSLMQRAYGGTAVAPAHLAVGPGIVDNGLPAAAYGAVHGYSLPAQPPPPQAVEPVQNSAPAPRYSVVSATAATAAAAVAQPAHSKVIVISQPAEQNEDTAAAVRQRSDDGRDQGRKAEAQKHHGHSHDG